MAFTFGFYNSINHDRKYDAIQMSSIFDGIILDGVYATIGKSMIVRVGEEAGTVVIQPGRAWFNHTWNLNDSDLLMNLPQSELILSRIDALVLDIDATIASRENKYLWVLGEPSSKPVRPTLIRTLEHNQYPLCYVMRKPNTETVLQEDITNTVGSSECPFVTGVLEHIDIDELLLQWRDQWANFVKNYEDAASDWMEEQQQDFLTFYNEFKTQANEFLQSSTQEFLDWFQNLQDILDENAAANLLNLINQESKKNFDRYYGLIDTTTWITPDAETNQIHVNSDPIVEGDPIPVQVGFRATIAIDLNGEDQNGNRVITETVIPYEGSYKYIKKTTFINVPVSETNLLGGTRIEERYSTTAK